MEEAEERVTTGGRGQARPRLPSKWRNYLLISEFEIKKN
jgi:hypothetical protein